MDCAANVNNERNIVQSLNAGQKKTRDDDDAGLVGERPAYCTIMRYSSRFSA
jgi:hypothetical protein